MVAVQWYPGHMEKARRDMQDSLKKVDIIVELRDARIPEASRNPLLDTMGQGKPRLILLAKEDLADPDKTRAWLTFLSQKQEQRAAAVDLVHDPGCRKLVLNQLRELGQPRIERMKRRGIHPRPLRVMAAGIPNVGKSTLINCLSGRRRVEAQDRPGVTRTLTWIHVDAGFDLLDTPGVLWPKFEDPRIGSLLAICGAVNENIVDQKGLAMDALHILKEEYPQALAKNYQIPADMRVDDMLVQIARIRHACRENNEPDVERAAGLFLREFRSGKLGRITLEKADEESL
jgi:ribosome biogenesis GTPase A